MTFPILIETNVFVYSVGRAHPLRAPSREILALVRSNEQFFTNAEVFQELLHRYRSLKVWATMRPYFDEFMSLMAGRIEPMLAEDVELAADLAGRYPRLAARDLIHIAVAQRLGAPYIVTADRAFDGVAGIERLDPARIEEWRERALVT